MPSSRKDKPWLKYYPKDADKIEPINLTYYEHYLKANKIYSIIVKDEALSLDEIKSTIKTVLPEYNFSHLFKVVDEIPINAVGKTDYIKIEKELIYGC